MNKEEIERIALECAQELAASEYQCDRSDLVDDMDDFDKQMMVKFSTLFLARIDAERGKSAIATIDFREQGWRDFVDSIRVLPDGTPLFLSPTIPADFSLYLEPAIISAQHAKWEDATILADDDPSYDTFCGGWNAAFKLLAAAQGERNAD